jgi:CRISPR-associated protein Cas1
MPEDSHEPLIRVQSLHAMTYCERLFYLEEVEEIRVADAAVYAGRTLHLELEQGEESRTFELASEMLGLVGKIDAVKHRDGGWVPYEHKRGRARRADDKTAEAWPADALQVSAYAMLLEAAEHQPVAEGRIRYHADNVTVRVPLDDVARRKVRAAVARAVELRSSTDRPPVSPNERLCVKCSLAPVCLPEEERIIRNPDYEALLLFPPHTEGKVIHVTTPGSRVGRSGDQLKVVAEDETPKSFPIEDVQAVVVHGYAQVTTQALHLCADRSISVHWLTGGGKYVGCLTPDAGKVQKKIRQYHALSDPGFCLKLARKLATARAEGQLRYLLRATRGSGRPEPVVRAFNDIRAALKGMTHAEGIDTVRGHEGQAAKAYFRALPCLFSDSVPDDLKPTGRSRRPPRDRFNALLSFGYALLYRSVMQAILAVQLEPALGFFHTPRSAAHPLVLDLMELFRVPLWDMPLVASVNRKQWELKDDFSITQDHVWLSDAGRKKAIGLFERRLQESWKHPVTDYSLSYARTIELEARLLEKEWTGQPGLFAQARIR